MSVPESKWYVGQEVFLRDVNEAPKYWKDGLPPRGIVTKVGRTLLTVEDQCRHPKTYRLDSGRANDKYEHALVQTLEDYADQKRRAELVTKLRQTGLFGGYHVSLKTDTLEAVLQVIEVMEAK